MYIGFILFILGQVIGISNSIFQRTILFNLNSLLKLILVFNCVLIVGCFSHKDISDQAIRKLAIEQFYERTKTNNFNADSVDAIDCPTGCKINYDGKIEFDSIAIFERINENSGENVQKIRIKLIGRAYYERIEKSSTELLGFKTSIPITIPCGKYEFQGYYILQFWKTESGEWGIK